MTVSEIKETYTVVVMGNSRSVEVWFSQYSALSGSDFFKI